MAASPGNGSIWRTGCAAPAEGVDPPRRVLYGRRRGRALRSGQRARMQALLPRLAVALPESGALDPFALFTERPRSLALEIGFGGGEHLAEMAARHPETGFIGCEVFENGIARLIARIERERLANIRIFADDARPLLAALPPASLDRVFILFPDPWPKARHKKRRILSKETLDRLAEIMADGAELRLATDDRDYLSQMLEVATGHPAFLWLAQGPRDWRERPAGWPPTRYEEKARAAGRVPLFLRFRRRPRDEQTTPRYLTIGHKCPISNG
jgi:tRNA (guanine-N7-)-methyltransferase